MHRKLLLLLFTILLSCVQAFSAPHKFTLVIDPGHGGKDAGALGKFSKEKNINLRTALAFGHYVEKNCPDVHVIYTRKTDVFVTLYERAEIANKAKADLFISIHTNALPAGHTARGFETYTLGMHRASDNLDVAKRENSVILVENDYKQHYEGFDPRSSESYIIFEFMQDRNMARSVELAKLVQNNVCRTASRPDKGVKQAGFLVLRETSMPSCLIELGFISTPDEEKYLNTEAGIDNMALGIFQAFASYRAKYDPNAKGKAAVVAAQKPSNSAEVTKATEPEKPSTPAVAEKKQPEKTADKKQPEKETADKKQSEKTVTEKKQSEKAAPENTASEKTVPVKDELAAPVFKVQITTSDKVMAATDRRLKGHKDASYYKEKGLIKYTVGETTDYSEILKIRKALLADFPDAFVIAFRNGEKMNVNDAISEYKRKTR